MTNNEMSLLDKTYETRITWRNLWEISDCWYKYPGKDELIKKIEQLFDNNVEWYALFDEHTQEQADRFLATIKKSLWRTCNASPVKIYIKEDKEDDKTMLKLRIYSAGGEILSITFKRI